MNGGTPAGTRETAPPVPRELPWTELWPHPRVRGRAGRSRVRKRRLHGLFGACGCSCAPGGRRALRRSQRCIEGSDDGFKPSPTAWPRAARIRGVPGAVRRAQLSLHQLQSSDGRVPVLESTASFAHEPFANGATATGKRHALNAFTRAPSAPRAGTIRVAPTAECESGNNCQCGTMRPDICVGAVRRRLF